MENLLALRARDIMEKDVLQLETLTPIEAAVETLEEYSIHGAPVVDEAGELVGVLSDTDILKQRRGGTPPERPSYYAQDPLDDEPSLFGGEDYSPEVLGRELVADWMTPQVISVSPDASVADICALMARERIHRVFVVENGRVRGVVSSFDIVKRLAAEQASSDA